MGGGGNEKENVRHPELLVSRTCVRERRRRASMSDPSESWVNNPGLFAVLSSPASAHANLHTDVNTQMPKHTHK